MTDTLPYNYGSIPEVIDNYPLYVPDKFRFPQTKVGLPALSTPVKIRSDTLNYDTQSNTQVRFLIPNGDIYDFREGYITFNMNILLPSNGAHMTYFKIQKYIYSIFNRMRVRGGGRDMEDILQYGQIYSEMMEAALDKDIKDYFGDAMNMGNDQSRNAIWMTSTANPTGQKLSTGAAVTAFPATTAGGGGGNYAFTCPLMSGVLGTQLMPLDAVAKAPLELYLYLAPAQTFIESDLGSAVSTIDSANLYNGDSVSGIVVTISNVQIHALRMTFDGAYTRKITDFIKMYGFKLGFHSYVLYQNTLNTSVAQFQATIQARYLSIHNLMHTFQPSSYSTFANCYNNKMISFYGGASNTNSGTGIVTTTNTSAGGLDLAIFVNPMNTNMQLNGKTFPDEPIVCTSGQVAGNSPFIGNVGPNMWEPYADYLRWLIKAKLSAFIPIRPPLDNRTYITNRFIQFDSFDCYPEVADIVNEFNTVQDNVAIIKNWSFNGNAPLNLTLNTWVEFFVRVRIGPSGAIEMWQ